MCIPHNQAFCFTDWQVCCSEPAVSLDILYRIPFWWIIHQNLPNQVFGLGRQVLRNFELSYQDFLVQLCCVWVFKWQVAADQCKENDATWPSVDLSANILLTGNHLWCSIARTTTCCLQLFLLAKSIREAKVNYFNVHFVVKQQIFRFEISVDNIKFVNVLHAWKNLLEKLATFTFFQFLFSNYIIEEFTPRCIFHDQKQKFGRFYDFVKLNYVRVSYKF